MHTRARLTVTDCPFLLLQQSGRAQQSGQPVKGDQKLIPLLLVDGRAGETHPPPTNLLMLPRIEATTDYAPRSCVSDFAAVSER